MARLITLLEQQLDRQPPTVVTQATTWWETVFTLVKLQEIGLGAGHILYQLEVIIALQAVAAGSVSPVST